MPKIFHIVEYGIFNSRNTSGTFTLPCGDWLLASMTAVATLSMLEDWICFRPLRGRECQVAQFFQISFKLRKANERIKTLFLSASYSGILYMCNEVLMLLW
ncbi:hypothetical protein TNIN_76871 [Trichonephila inaurata madagascariensis]|uniref:Uncharacterized protein n=1 Tax=Trichonephila inaurata madagascariensis TaxID=2747483 RepID=A0A8X6M9G9_9ARAC|nr:hypothetical protein TNIN_76871 [Trichonephila inaurata madagascariensis]